MSHFASLPPASGTAGHYQPAEEPVSQIALPLSADVSRCMAIGEPYGAKCQHADNCARYLTVRHDSLKTLQNAKVHNRACSDDNYLLHMPMTGMPTLGGR